MMTSTRRSKIPSGVPVTMINLVAFFPEAQYEDANEEPRSGMEACLDAGTVRTALH
jgi:hypothetical protein